MGHIPEISREVWPGVIFREVGKGGPVDIQTFNGADMTYYGISGLVWAGGEWRVNGNATAHALSCTTVWCDIPDPVCELFPTSGPDAIMTVEAGSTQTVENWRVYGDATLPLIVRSSSPGEPWTLNCTSPWTCASDYIELSDSTCSGTTPCYAGSHSMDGGGNTNWVFADPPPTPTSTATPTPTPTASPTPTETPTATPTPQPVSCEAASDFCAVVFANNQSCEACLCGESGIVSNCGSIPESTVCGAEVASIITESCPCPMTAACAAAIAESCPDEAQCYCAPPTPP